MSIVCAKNFAKIIGRPHRTRVPPRFKTQNCRIATIASAHGELRAPESTNAIRDQKNTFRILEKTRRNLPYGSKSQHDKYTHPVPAHNNTLLLRRFSRRAIALQHESYTRPRAKRRDKITID